MRIAYFRRLVKIGNSTVLIVPRDVRIMIGAKEGDWIRIEVEKFEVKEDDGNLHDHNAARSGPQARTEGIHPNARYPQMDNCEGNRPRRV